MSSSKKSLKHSVRGGEEVISSKTSSSSSAAVKRRASADANALLIIGTYHSVMLGLVLRNHKFLLKFSVKHHDGCVNAVAACSKYVATCGYDERVFLFTNKMTPRKQLLESSAAAYRIVNNPQLADLGTLTPPSEVTCMRWAAGSSFLLCGCGDGSLLAYRSRDWSVALSLIVHEKGINDIAIHPGKRGAAGSKSSGDGGGGTLAVTIGADRFVAVLDLVSGKLLTKWRIKLSNPNKRMRNSAYQRMKEKQAESGAAGEEDVESGTASGTSAAPLLLSAMFMDEPSHVLFSPAGDYFVVLTRFMLFVYRTATMALMSHYEMKRRRPEDELHCIAFHTETSVFVGNESGDILYYDFTEKKKKDVKSNSGEAGASKKRKRQETEKNESGEKGEQAEEDSVESGEVTILRRNVPRAVIESQRSSGRAESDTTDEREEEKRMTRLKYPYKHVARIKTLSFSCTNAIQTSTASSSNHQGSGAATSSRSKGAPNPSAASSVEGEEASILFTVDTHGIVIAWDVSAIQDSISGSAAETHDNGLEYNTSNALNYIASANCQGRATSMEVMML